MPAARKPPIPREALAFARQLRQRTTDAESRLWMLLRNRNLHGLKFRRQHPFPPYTLDFYCQEISLAVELDGGQHLESAKDTQRDAYLAGQGIKTLRYWNHDVLARTEWVLEDLWHQVDELLMKKSSPPDTPPRKAPSPNPLPEGEGLDLQRPKLPSPPGRGVGGEGVSAHAISNSPKNPGRC